MKKDFLKKRRQIWRGPHKSHRLHKLHKLHRQRDQHKLCMWQHSRGQIKDDACRGNAVIYVLIALALIGALTFTLSRQNQQADSQNIDDETLVLRTTQILQHATAVKGVIDQMVISGTAYGQLDFAQPSDPAFDTPPHIHKVYHPQGGGLTYRVGAFPGFTGASNDPGAGWYIGMFNHVEWTPTTAQDIILTAHQISESLCENINRKITGATTIPALAGTGNIEDYLIDDSNHTGANADFTAAVCADCDEWPSLCVSNAGGNRWSFYNIIQGR